MNCSKCGAELVGAKRFCSSCGAPAEASPVAPLPPRPPAAPDTEGSLPRQSSYGPPPAPLAPAAPPPPPPPAARVPTAPSPVAAPQPPQPPQPQAYPPQYGAPYNPNDPSNQIAGAADRAANWAAGALNAFGNAVDRAVSQPAYPQPPPYPGPPAQPAPQPAYGAQPQYGPPPAPFAPGARVLVQWADGNRYPATIAQLAPNHCLVVFPDGQQRWVEVQYLTPGA